MVSNCHQKMLETFSGNGLFLLEVQKKASAKYNSFMKELEVAPHKGPKKIVVHLIPNKSCQKKLF